MGAHHPWETDFKTNICTSSPFSNFRCKKWVETRGFRESRNSSWCCSVTASLKCWNSFWSCDLTLKSGLSGDCFLNLAFTGGLLLLGLEFILPRWAFLQGFLHCAVTYSRMWGKLWFRNCCCQLMWFELSTAVFHKVWPSRTKDCGKEREKCLYFTGW